MAERHGLDDASGHRRSSVSRFQRYEGGDPLAPPVDLAEALDAIGEDVMAGYSPERALGEFLRRGGRDQAGLDDLARRVAERRRDLVRRHDLGGTLQDIQKLLDHAVLEERKQLARDVDMDDTDRSFALAVAELVAERMKAAEGALRTSPHPATGPLPPPASGNPAHDLRNALAEILAHAELITMTTQLPAGAAARLAGITASANRAVAVLRGLFEPAPAADPGTGEYKAVPPRTVDDQTDEHTSLPPPTTG